MTEPSGEPDHVPEAPHPAWPNPNPYPPSGYGPPLQPYPGFMPGAAAPRGNGLGIASLAVGLVALPAVLTIVGGLILGMAAVIMGLVARGRVKSGEATGGSAGLVGIVLGLMAVVASAFVIWLVFGTELFNEGYQRCLDQRGGGADACQEYR